MVDSQISVGFSPRVKGPFPRPAIYQSSKERPMEISSFYVPFTRIVEPMSRAQLISEKLVISYCLLPLFFCF